MSESANNRSIRIEESAVGSAIVSGDGNTIYVIQQTKEQARDESETEKLTEIGHNPYKGLAAFKESDAARYFGREVQIKRLWQRFQALYEQSEVPRLLPILGPSGCGKSSLARAGFIPELARNPLPGKEQMRVAVLMPGSRPLEALAGVLAKAVTSEAFPLDETKKFKKSLQEPSDDGEYEGLRLIAGLIPDVRNTPLVILVDQFEEVYSLCDDVEQRQAFIANLLHAASEPTGEVSVVITLRSDFLGETQRHPKLNQIIGSDQSAFVPAMTTAELRSAIAEPAKKAAHPLDEATIDLLVKDAEGREGALPLLQFSLSRIWQGLGEGQTPIITYREMGGVGGALAGKAQDIYNRLSDSEQKIARRVFVGLVQLGEGTRDTRRRVRVETLIAKGEALETIQKIIHLFSSSSARLITLSSASGHEIAEVTHEALFEYWQQLNDWLDRSRNDIRFHRRLETVAQYWEEQGRPDGLLWRSPDLDLLRDYQQRAAQDMTETEAAFWHASNRIEQRQKQTKRLVTGGLALLLGLTSISTGVAFWNVRAANRNSIKVLAQSAAALNASGDSFDALITALRAEKQLKKSWFSDPAILKQIRAEVYAVLSSANRELTRLEGHSGSIRVVRFSHDGNTIATASFDNTARLWKTDGTLITTLDGHSDEVINVRFSHDGNTIATASFDNTTKLWKTDGTLITTLDGHSGTVWDMRFSPNSNTIATAHDDSTTRLWKTDGTLITTLDGHKDAVINVHFSPDGNTIATASRDNTARLWKTDGTLITTLDGHSNAVMNVRFSPDGNTIATFDGSNDVKLWTADGTLINTLEGHSADVRAFQFSPDGSTIATASRDNTAKLWKTDGTLISTLEGHSADVMDVRFSPDGSTIATASFDRTVKLWKPGGPAVSTFGGHNTYAFEVRFSSDGNIIATIGGGGQVKLWKANGTLVTLLKSHNSEVSEVRFSSDDNTIATASRDGTAKLWNANGTLITILKGHKDEVSEVRFSPDDSTIATASHDGTAKLWNADGSLLTTLEGHSDAVLDVRFSPDGNLIATASSDNTVKLWKTDGTLVTTLKGNIAYVLEVHFSPDGNTIATTTSEGRVKLWETDGTLITTLKTPQRRPIRTLRFSPVQVTTPQGLDDIIATVSFGNTVNLWKTNGTLIATLEGHSASVQDISFSPDGKIIATASRDNTAKLWKIDGTLVATLEDHSDMVEAVRFSPDGNTIITVSRDGIAKLWHGYPDVLAINPCQQLQGYLKSSPNIEPEDRKLCD